MKYLEVCIYGLLNLSYLILAIMPFWDRLRFSKKATYFVIGGFGLIQIFFSMWAGLWANESYRGLVSGAALIVYLILFAIIIKAHFGKKLFMLIMLINISSFINIAGKYFENLFFGKVAWEKTYALSYSLCVFALQLLILIPVGFSIIKLFKGAIENEMVRSAWKYLWLIPTTFYFVWFFHVYSLHHSPTDFAMSGEHVLFLFIVDLGAYFVYYTAFRFIKELGKNVTLEENNHHLAMQHLQYENLHERILEARHAKHDIRHHITIMSSYLASKEYDKLEKYLNSYKKSLPDESSIMLCENQAINALLVYFAGLSRDADTDFKVLAKIPKEIKIRENDACVVLGNLLENALHACDTDNSTDRRLSIAIDYSDSCMLIAIDNTFDGKLKKSFDGTLLTTKKDGTGVGLESVKNIVKSYNGLFNYEVRDQMFCVSVMLNTN